MDKLHSAIMEGVRDGLKNALRLLLSGDGSLDTELWRGDWSISAAESDSLIGRLLVDSGASSDESSDVPADRTTHQHIAAAIQNCMPHSVVVGQKATTTEWCTAEGSGDGTIIFLVDAIDGATPYKTLTFGYSTNILAFRRESNLDRLLIAVVANPNGPCLTWDGVDLGDPGVATLGDWTSFNQDQAEWGRVLSAPLADPIPGTVAVLAASPRHRAHSAQLLASDGLTIFTTGGAPASLGLAAGRLESLAATRKQTLYDAAYLPALVTLGIHVVSLEDGTELTQSGVERLFSRVARTPSDREVRPVPPFVASRSREAALQVRERLRNPARNSTR